MVVPKTSPRRTTPLRAAPAPSIKREDVLALDETLHDLKDVIESAVETALDAKSRRWRRVFIAMVAGGLAVAVVAVVALVGMYRANDANDSLQAIVKANTADLTQRRIDACERDNTTRAATRLVAKTTAGGFNQFAALLIGNTPIDSELQKQIDLFQTNVIKPFLALTDEKTGPFADRDCSVKALSVPANS